MGELQRLAALTEIPAAGDGAGGDLIGSITLRGRHEGPSLAVTAFGPRCRAPRMPGNREP